MKENKTVYTQHCFVVLAALCLVAVLGSPVQAKRQNFRSFSVDVPAGWKVSEEGRLVMFSKGKCFFSLLEVPLYNGDLAVMLAEQARIYDTGEMRSLGSGEGMVFTSKVARHWGMVPGDVFVAVDVAAACGADVEAKLKSLRAEKDGQNVAGMQKALETLAHPEVMNWLVKGQLPSGAAAQPVPAAPAGMEVPLPDLKTLGGDAPPFMEITPLAALPEGWERSQQGAWTVFSRDGGKQWLAVRAYAFDSAKVTDENMSLYDDFAVKLATTLGGINIMTGGGMTSCATLKGYSGDMDMGEGCVTVKLAHVPDYTAYSDLVTRIFQGDLQ